MNLISYRSNRKIAKSAVNSSEKKEPSVRLLGAVQGSGVIIYNQGLALKRQMK